MAAKYRLTFVTGCAQQSRWHSALQCLCHPHHSNGSTEKRASCPESLYARCRLTKHCTFQAQKHTLFYCSLTNALTGVHYHCCCLVCLMNDWFLVCKHVGVSQPFWFSILVFKVFSKFSLNCSLLTYILTWHLSVLLNFFLLVCIYCTYTCF